MSVQQLVVALLAALTWPRLARALGATLATLALAALGAGELDRVEVLSLAHASSTATARAWPPPRASAARPASPSASAPGAHASARALAPKHPHGPVVLNTATVAELCSLPGIGPRRAEQIVALREKLGGRFKRLEDLRRIKGFGRKALELIRPLVVLDAPGQGPPARPTG